jgi:hypothetical protein
MNQSFFTSPLPGSRSRYLCGVALLGAAVLIANPASAKDPKTPPPSTESSEARSRELLKKHFPLEEDIGPLPVVRVPKADEPKAPAPGAKAGRARHAAKPRAEVKAAASTPPAAPPAGVSAPASSEVPDVPLDPSPVAPAPRPPEEPKEPKVEHGDGPSLGSEDNRQIDDLLSRALTDAAPAAPPPPQADTARPPLGMAAIKQTMASVQPGVTRSCRLGRLGVVLVKVVVTPSGEVARVTPEGKSASMRPAPCVVDQVRRARFPQSAGGTFEYTLTVR